jgi:hypothetical protein
MTTPSDAEIIPNRWVRFTRAWDWDIPKYWGRATKTFAAGAEVRLTRAQFQSAMAAGVAVSIPNPRASRTAEADHGRPSHLDDHA